MFLRIVLVLLVFPVALLQAELAPRQGHSSAAYRESIEIVKRKIVKDPENLLLQKELILFSYALEDFDTVVDAGKRYLSKTSDHEVEHLLIVAYAACSEYQSAITQLDHYNNSYSLHSDHKELLLKKRALYVKALNASLWKKKRDVLHKNKKRYFERAVGVDSSKGIVMVVDEKAGELFGREMDSGRRVPLTDMPDLTKIVVSDIVSIAFNAKRTEAILSYKTDRGSLIAIAHYTNYEWKPLTVEPEFNIGTVNLYPQFVADGTTLLYVSNRAESGTNDIYYVQKKGMAFGTSKPILQCSSGADEGSLYVANGSSTLFFSSNGRVGLGGYDLYRADFSVINGVPRFEGAVENLVAINSYHNEIDPPYVTLNNSKVWLMRHLLDGRQLVVCNKGTLQPNVAFSTSHSFSAESVVFMSGSAILEKSALSFLRRFAQFLLKNPSITVVIGGHCDSTGEEAHNTALSLHRAKAVAHFLHSSGVAKERLSVVGYGSTKNIAPNSSAHGRRKNRRVEFTLSE